MAAPSHFTTLSELFDSLVAAGKMTDGEYLAGMNALGKIHAAAPPLPLPSAGAAVAAAANAAAADQYALIHNTVAAYNWDATDNDRFWPLIEAFHAHGVAPTASTAAAVETHFTMDRLSLGWRFLSQGTEFKCLTLRDAVFSLPAVRRCAIAVAEDRKDMTREMLKVLRNGITEEAVARFCYALDLPFHPTMKWNKRTQTAEPIDKARHHRVVVSLRLTEDGTATELPVELYTRLIQLGRTECVAAISAMAVGIALHTGQTEKLGLLICRSLNVGWGGACPRMTTSGITGKTKSKRRTYADMSERIFTITYADKLNTGEETA